MFNGNMDCLGVPWEILVKDFRNSEGDEDRPTVAQWAKAGEALMDLRKKSAFKGKGSLDDLANENLAPADHLLVRMRRNMLKAAADLQKGIDPVTIPADVAYGIRLGQGILDDPKAWREHIPNADEARVTPAG